MLWACTLKTKANKRDLLKTIQMMLLRTHLMHVSRLLFLCIRSHVRTFTVQCSCVGVLAHSTMWTFIYTSSMQSDSFYGLFPDGPRGSASYIARAVVNKVLQEGLQYDPSKSCSVS